MLYGELATTAVLLLVMVVALHHLNLWRYSSATHPVSSSCNPDEGSALPPEPPALSPELAASCHAMPTSQEAAVAPGEVVPVEDFPAMAMEPSIPDSDLETSWEVLGEGGFAQVYAGRWRGTHVAIKVPKNNSPSLEIEAATLTHLLHPCICTFMGTAMLNGKLAIVMEHLDGGSLDRFLQLDVPRPERRAISFGHRMAIAQQAADGLAFLHTMGYVHRDVKSANILLTGAGHAKVTDFGIAKHGALGSTRGEWTNTPFVGTIRYMAPEVMMRQSSGAPYTLEGLEAGKKTEAVTIFDELLRRPSASPQAVVGEGSSGESTVEPMVLPQTTHRQGVARYGTPSDVYSFGLMLYEMVYRERAFHEFSQLQFVYAFTFRGQRPTLPPPSFRAAQEPPAGGETPDEDASLVVEILISSCWQHAPNVRPPMAKVFETLLTIQSAQSHPSMPAATGPVTTGAKQTSTRWGRTMRLAKSVQGFVRRPRRSLSVRHIASPTSTASREGFPPGGFSGATRPPGGAGIGAGVHLQPPSANSAAGIIAEQNLHSAKVQPGTRMAAAIEEVARSANEARASG